MTESEHEFLYIKTIICLHGIRNKEQSKYVSVHHEHPFFCTFVHLHLENYTFLCPRLPIKISFRAVDVMCRLFSDVF